MHVRRAADRDAEAVANVLREAFVEYERPHTRDSYAATTPSAAAELLCTPLVTMAKRLAR